MRPIGNSVHTQEREIVRERHSQSMGQLACIDSFRPIEMRGHGEGMNARICPSGSGDREFECATQEASEPSLQLTLNSAKIGLLLPAVEATAMIGNIETVSHALSPDPDIQPGGPTKYEGGYDEKVGSGHAKPHDALRDMRDIETTRGEGERHRIAATESSGKNRDYQCRK
jgi:hypothetical protein